VDFITAPQNPGGFKNFERSTRRLLGEKAFVELKQEKR